MYSDEELLAFKDLAQRAKPFIEDDPDPDEETSEGLKSRRQANQEFFLKAHELVPQLIDEVIQLRRLMAESI